MVTINEADTDLDGEPMAPSISLSACKEYSPDLWLDFDEIEAVPNEDELIEEYLNAIHASSNLV